MKIKILSTLVIISLLLSCTKENETKKLTIVAAASSQFAVKELAEQFSKENNVEVDVIIGSSGKLTTQIMNGAPYDIFFSANMGYPKSLYESKMTIEVPRNYGYGIPVLWSMDSTITFDKNGTILLDSTIEKIAIANPKNAPYGEMAVKYFKDKNIYEAIESKLVYGESISQVNEYILSKTVLVGVSAKSIILSPNIENKGVYLSFNKDYWIEQGVVELNRNETSKARVAFMKFIFSPAGEKILQKYGYEK